MKIWLVVMQKQGKRAVFKETLGEFLDNTTFHALKFVWIEGYAIGKIVWILVFCLGLGFSTILCVNVWNRWEDSPIVTSISDYPLINTTFPAVTVCQRRYSEEKIGCKELLGRRVSLIDLTELADESKILYNIEEYFTLIQTHGYCCTFNSALNYPIINNSLYYRRKRTIRDHGIETGLFVPLSLQSGYKVLVHDPLDFPEVQEQGLICEANHSCVVSVQATAITASPEVVSVPVNKRGCLFDNELIMEHLPRYSASNCRTEMRSKIATGRTICGCENVWKQKSFFGPTAQNRSCITINNPARPSANQCWFYYRIELNKLSTCLPRCNEVRYHSEIVQIMGSRDLNRDNTSRIPLETSLSLQIYIKSLTGFKYKSDVAYGWSDFLSVIGGSFGLGLGASLISFVEVVYFCTCRWWTRNQPVQQLVHPQ